MKVQEQVVNGDKKLEKMIGDCQDQILHVSTDKQVIDVLADRLRSVFSKEHKDETDSSARHDNSFSDKAEKMKQKTA